MDAVCLVLAVTGSSLLLVLGLLGCVAPVIPGPALSYAAMLLLLPTRFAPSVGECVAYGVACAVVLFLDSVIPAMGAKKFNCSRWGVAGCMIGTVVGMFFGFTGLIFGPFLGAMAGELVAGKNFLSSLKGGFGAFLGFVFGVLVKVVYCAVCAVWCLFAFFK
ncbi:MAG: DUF456 domain-containing protein [Lentisphaerae bacterium]|nr:DUF456 domain-containing protein [Lentisphaerota bacterium]